MHVLNIKNLNSKYGYLLFKKKKSYQNFDYAFIKFCSFKN